METESLKPYAAASKTGIKTIDKITDLPVVNSALNNVTGYYEQIKDKNVLLRTSCNLAELSFKTMKFASTPITSLCAGPIESVDIYLSDKVEKIEDNYPIINKPADEISSAAYTQAKDLYDKSANLVTNPKETLYHTVSTATNCGCKVLNTCIDNRYTKMVADPVLDYTEKTLNNYLTPLDCNSGEPLVRRIYNINKRVYDHVYDATFIQLKNLHAHFEYTITKMLALKNIVEEKFNEYKEPVVNTVSELTLVKLCQSYLEKNNITLESAKMYYKALLADVNDIIGKYMGLIKNFPAYLDGIRFQEKIDWLKNQMNKETFSIYLSMSIEYLKKINESLMDYTKKMIEVADLKFPLYANKLPFGLEKSNQESSESQKN